ncbi:MAG: glycosyltransferase family 4 protein [Candidatus Krumholzibacteria bacterium]|nr:glycosyltransferase family 4 protein [Candidatus Krumholzibacteria bacterium]
MKDRLERILVLSIWDDIWSLGEGCGVPDEMHFIDRLTERGVKIDYLIPEPPHGGAPYKRDGLEYHFYPNIFRSHHHLPGPARRLLQSARYSATIMPVLRKLVERTGPDLILGYSNYTLKAISRIGHEKKIPTAAKLFGVMYLNHRHLPWWKYWWYNYEQILSLRRDIDHYVVLNDGTQGDRALARYGVDPKKISFLPNGMNMEWADLDVDVNEARKEFGLPEDKTLLVTFSRLVRSKRVDLFLEAAAAIDPSLLEKTAIVIGGDGPERRSLERRAKELGLSARVYFPGAVKYDSVPRLLKACDIFVGTNELTNMSMPPCEALLCGIPVVAFNIAGTSEAVIDGRTGLLTPVGDIPTLTSAIETLLKDPGHRKRLGANASSFAVENFMSWEDRTLNELKILESLVTDR